MTVMTLSATPSGSGRGGEPAPPSPSPTPGPPGRGPGVASGRQSADARRSGTGGAGSEACGLQVLTYASPHPLAALAAAELALAGSGAELVLLRVKPVGGMVETVLKLQGITDRAGAALAERLARQPSVGALRLEHVRGPA